MNEMSYADAVDSGLEPVTYRSDALRALGNGDFAGNLDALVWAKRQPCLMALVTLDSDIRVQVSGFQRHNRQGLPEYLGLRRLAPGQRVVVRVEIGVRGGMLATVLPAASADRDLTDDPATQDFPKAI